MPSGSKSSNSKKLKRQADHVEESVKKRGRARPAASRIGWATVTKLTSKDTKKASKRK